MNPYSRDYSNWTSIEKIRFVWP